jgi:hypothetical protein
MLRQTATSTFFTSRRIFPYLAAIGGMWIIQLTCRMLMPDGVS